MLAISFSIFVLSHLYLSLANEIFMENNENLTFTAELGHLQGIIVGSLYFIPYLWYNY